MENEFTEKEEVQHKPKMSFRERIIMLGWGVLIGMFIMWIPLLVSAVLGN